MLGINVSKVDFLQSNNSIYINLNYVSRGVSIFFLQTVYLYHIVELFRTALIGDNFIDDYLSISAFKFQLVLVFPTYLTQQKHLFRSIYAHIHIFIFIRM